MKEIKMKNTTVPQRPTPPPSKPQPTTYEDRSEHKGK